MSKTTMTDETRQRLLDLAGAHNIEIWQEGVRELTCCCGVYSLPESCVSAVTGCPSCGSVSGKVEPWDGKRAWFWQTCVPGCLPDSDVFGPFDTDEEAIADATEGLDDGEEV